MVAIMSRSPTLRKSRLHVIDLGSASAIDTLAVPDGIAAGLGREDDPVLVLADPIEPFLCVGANEDIERRIDLLFCREEGILVLRRSIGGRAIYIDRDQLIFHIIVPLSHAPRPVARIMPRLVTGIIDTVRDFGLAARLGEPSDVVVAGRKIAGAAGAEIGDTLVVGGTILLNFDNARMIRCLKTPSGAFRIRLHRLLDRRLTTFCKELDNTPPRRTIKIRFVRNIARCLNAEPCRARVPAAHTQATATTGFRPDVPA
jgi:lipoate-protein ligase A